MVSSRGDEKLCWQEMKKVKKLCDWPKGSVNCEGSLDRSLHSSTNHRNPLTFSFIDCHFYCSFPREFGNKILRESTHLSLIYPSVSCWCARHALLLQTLNEETTHIIFRFFPQYNVTVCGKHVPEVPGVL